MTFIEERVNENVGEKKASGCAAAAAGCGAAPPRSSDEATPHTLRANVDI